MTSLQAKSAKISKIPKKDADGADTSFKCGGCSNSYKSYPALYLHIKRKHSGVRPANTKVSKPTQQVPATAPTAQTGRPSKPLHNVDDLPQNELCLEEAQNELLGFLGERVMCISGFEDKLRLEDVINRILAIPRDNRDKWFSLMQEKCQGLFAQNGEALNLDFEEEFRNLSPEDGLTVMSWFVLWLGKNFVKKDFIADLFLIVAKIWKVLDETQLQIQDLDNKLVWKKAMAECKLVIGELGFFKRDEELIYEFIQKVCQLIGKVFE